MIGVEVDVAGDLGLGQRARGDADLDLLVRQVRDPQQRHVVQVGGRRHRVALQVVDDVVQQMSASVPAVVSTVGIDRLAIVV